jgi:carboxylate-amine ligase
VGEAGSISAGRDMRTRIVDHWDVDLVFTENKKEKEMSAFRFGLEAEFLICDKRDWTPLWHEEISFETLHGVLDKIPFEDVATVEGLELEPPHRKLMPFVVEGYHVPDHNLNAVDIRPKGVEIRTSVTRDLNQCLSQFEVLHRRLIAALEKPGWAPVALSHHPIKTKFTGPQNKRRHDFWQWAMEVMTTYGPDINIAVPAELQKDLDVPDLEAKIDHYGPAMAALSVASPFVNGDLWRIRGQAGRSFRMYKRSVIAPPIETHPDED